MNKYIIVTESGADLSPDIIRRHHIHVMPMHAADYTKARLIAPVPSIMTALKTHKQE